MGGLSRPGTYGKPQTAGRDRDSEVIRGNVMENSGCQGFAVSDA